MRVEQLIAEPDLVGRRVTVAWDLVPEAGETLADTPPLRLRAKHRDFEFPAPDDEFVVYDSRSFPPPGTTLVAEVERSRTRDGDLVTDEVVETASVDSGGGRLEAARRTRWTTRDGNGAFVRRREQVLDVGGGTGLAAGTPRYYELRADGGPAPVARAIATPTEAHGTAKVLYDLVPTAHRRHDVVGPPGGASTAVGDIPETATTGGQLRRFLDLFGLAADQMRSRADHLRDLHDVVDGDARYLGPLAETIGWDLSRTADIPLRRHEVRFASTLYRLTGTALGCRIWVKRLTGWDAEIVELWRNVLFTNDLGSGSVHDRGSRTVDTADAELLGGRGTVDDQLDYTHDSGTGPDARRYALHAIGVFVTPDADQRADLDALFATRDRLLANTSLFLPLNLRLVVVLDLPTTDTTGDAIVGVTASTDPD